MSGPELYTFEAKDVETGTSASYDIEGGGSGGDDSDAPEPSSSTEAFYALIETIAEAVSDFIDSVGDAFKSDPAWDNVPDFWVNADPPPGWESKDWRGGGAHGLPGGGSKPGREEPGWHDYGGGHEPEYQGRHPGESEQDNEKKKPPQKEPNKWTFPFQWTQRPIQPLSQAYFPETAAPLNEFAPDWYNVRVALGEAVPPPRFLESVGIAASALFQLDIIQQDGSLAGVDCWITFWQDPRVPPISTMEFISAVYSIVRDVTYYIYVSGFVGTRQELIEQFYQIYSQRAETYPPAFQNFMHSILQIRPFHPTP